MLDSRFLPPGQEAAPEAANPGAGHLLYLAPQQAYLDGNAVVTLAGLAEPLVVALRGTGGAADFRVDIRLAMPGPNADPTLLAQPEGFHVGDPVLLGLLGGAVPPDAAPGAATKAALGLPLAGHPAGGRERPGPRDSAFVPLIGNHGRTEGDRQ